MKTTWRNPRVVLKDINWHNFRNFFLKNDDSKPKLYIYLSLSLSLKRLQIIFLQSSSVQEGICLQGLSPRPRQSSSLFLINWPYVFFFNFNFFLNSNICEIAFQKIILKYRWYLISIENDCCTFLKTIIYLSTYF